MCRPFSGLLAALFLTSCGAIGDLMELKDQLDRANDAGAMRGRLDDLPGTAYAAMPEQGRATFDGYAVIRVDPVAGPDVSMLGDLSLDVDFGQGTVTGQADDFYAQIGMSAGAAVGGALVIGGTQSQIAVTAPNDWQADYAGTLTVEGSSYGIGGILDGVFVGTRVGVGPDQTVKGTLAGDTGLAGTGTGGLAPYVIGIMAEN